MPRVFALLCVLFPLLAGAASYPPVDVEVRAEQLAAHSWFVRGLPGAASPTNQGFMSNAGFVVTPAGVVVFDALGSPSLAAEMVKRIREITTAPLRYVILSHYHADHYYGLQVFKELGAEIWAHEAGRGTTASEGARLRYQQRKEILAPWINDQTQRFPEPDRWLAGDADFELGGVHFLVRHVGPAHSPEDLALFVQEDAVLYSGDLIFRGRIPFVGDADSRQWLGKLEQIIAFQPRVMAPGHGPASSEPEHDLRFTRDYLSFLRQQMGRAVAELVPFEVAYANTDWSAYMEMPAFREANRSNAYNTYILMEMEALGK